jgi:hypothetical protein
MSHPNIPEDGVVFMGPIHCLVGCMPLRPLATPKKAPYKCFFTCTTDEEMELHLREAHPDLPDVEWTYTITFT